VLLTPLLFVGDVTTRAVLQNIVLGNSVEAQQVGIVWASEDALVSLSLCGTLNVLNPQEGKITAQIHVSGSAAACATLLTSDG
jgi:hypothetical protein